MTPASALSPELLERWSKIMDRVATVPETLEAMDNRLKKLEGDFGKIPVRGVPLPGNGEWGETMKDAAEKKRLFLEFCRCAWAGRALDGTSDYIKRALTEGSETGGGYLVPEIFVPELLRVVEASGIMRPLVRVLPMVTDTSNIPSLTSSMTVYWPGENQEITQTDPVFGRVQLTAKMMAALTSASVQLEEDNQLGLAEILVQLFGEAIANEEDKQILAANAAPFTGLLYNSTVNVVTMGSTYDAFTDLAWNDVADLIDSITTAAKRGARFFMHRNITNLMRKIRDANHQYIWSPPTGSDPANIWGYPYTECDQLPSATDTGASKAFVAFGNPKHILLGDRKRITLARSTEAGFKQNETFWKVTERIAVAIGVPTAFGRLRTAAS